MKSRRRIRLHPTYVLVFGFAGLICLGGWLLTLPQAAIGPPLPLVDAFFTACSAVCVTGLVVVDTGSALSGWGQGLVLGLIQVGGLGIMTLSTLFLVLIGRELSFSTYRLFAQSHLYWIRLDVKRLTIRIIVFTLVIEALGAGFIYWGGLSLWGRVDHRAAWWAVFHAISAFCNAGFALQADSLRAFQGSWIMNLSVVCLIVLGGVGFPVLNELWLRLCRRTQQPWTLHTRLVLTMTALLLALGALSVWLLEAHGAMASLPWGRKFLVSLFQSATARTAGFNTIDLDLMQNATLFVLMLLMFIGASPGSCGGGVKTTTAAVFWSVIRARFRDQIRPRLLNRSLPPATVGQAVTLFVSAALIVVAFTVLLLIFMDQPTNRGHFLDAAFEVISAFGTVGLSLGLTGELNASAKWLIMALMFIGRLGPLTLAFLLKGEGKPERFSYAEEAVIIG